MIYKGNTRYKIYNGNGLKAIKHPSFPKFIEYLGGTGTQYINTHITSFTNLFEIFTVLSASSANGSSQPTFMSFFGIQCYWSASSSTFRMWSSTGGTQVSSVTMVANRKHTAYYAVTSNSQRRMRIDFEQMKTSSGTYTSLNYPPCLFCWKSNSSPSYMPVMKVYGCRIYDNGTLIRDFHPCLSAENGHAGEPALYDVINNTYLYNEGTGTFETGPEL